MNTRGYREKSVAEAHWMWPSNISVEFGGYQIGAEASCLSL